MRFFAIAFLAVTFFATPTLTLMGLEVSSVALADDKDKSAKELMKLEEERDRKIEKAQAEYERDLKEAEKEVVSLDVV